MSAVLESDYEQISPKVEAALKKGFGPNIAIELNKGYLGRVQVKFVSAGLNGKSEREKQEMIWDVLKQELNQEAESVAYVLGYGMDEL